MPTINFKLGGSLEFVLDEQQQPTSLVTIHHQGFTVSIKGNHMAYSLPNDHLVKVQVAYQDAKGNPAAVDEIIWSSSNDAIATVEADSDDTSIATVTPASDVGNVQITATADADMGDGRRNLVTLMDVTVLAGEAVAGTISPLAEPEPIDPHAAQQRR